ncbi:MAG: glycosyltransferase [Chloroflexi bacterium]|nr:glycosyltransferase [Chloroflexota bacterium]
MAAGGERTLTYSFLSKLGGKSMSAAAHVDVSTLIRDGWRGEVLAPSFARPVQGAWRQRSTMPGFAPIVYRMPNFKQDWGGFVRDTLHDALAARLMTGSAVFHGWARGSSRSLERARAFGAFCIIEIATSHAAEQNALLNRERREFGYTERPEHHPWSLKRHEAEYAAADAVLVWSTAARDSFLARGMAAGKVFLHPPRYSFRARASSERAPASPLRVLFVGQVCLRKGVHYLLQAWELLRHPSAELWLCGDVGADIQPYLRSHPLPGSVKLTGFVQDPSPLFEAATVFVLPSIEDGFGLVVAEAMSYGVPVVVSENVGARDLVRDGESGVVVPIRNAAALAQALERLLSAPDAALGMGARGRDLLAERAARSPSIAGIYDKLLHQR